MIFLDIFLGEFAPYRFSRGGTWIRSRATLGVRAGSWMRLTEAASSAEILAMHEETDYFQVERHS